MQKNTLKEIVLNALIASSYIVLVLVFSFLSFDFIQFRIAEALLILIFFNKKLAPGLIIGTFVSNIFGMFGLVDAIVGSLATSAAILLMFLFIKNVYLSLIFPAITNGLIIGYMITYLSDTPFLLNFSLVFLGEVVVMYTIGLLLYLYINKNPNIKELLSNK